MAESFQTARLGLFWQWDVWLRYGVVNGLLATAADPAEAQRGGEDRSPPLPRLHGSGHKAPPIAYPLDMV